MPDGPRGDRRRSFRLADGVALKGGYAGFGHPDPDARDIRRYETILSGDLNGDDGPGFANRDDNSEHVVDGRGVSASTLLEGFTIERGESRGIDILRAGSDLTIRGCIIRYNRAAYGGGIRAQDSNPTLVSCVFIGNATTENPISTGGGMFIAGSGHATLWNCTFVGNWATDTGGGLWNASPGTTVTNCIFWGNAAGGASGESAQLIGGGAEFNSCCIEGWTGGLRGRGCFGDDPLLREEEEGSYRLSPGSPCIDRGDPVGSDEIGQADIDGQPRLMGDRVDVGADEYPVDAVLFRRGDANADGAWDIADPLFSLNYQFAAGPTPTCLKTADANDDGIIDLGDPIYVLNYLFLSGPSPADPFGACGPDPTDDALGCADYGPCR